MLERAVTIAADGTVHHVTDRVSAEHWSVARFTPTDTSLAAVVVRGHVHRIRFFDILNPDPEEQS